MTARPLDHDAPVVTLASLIRRIVDDDLAAIRLTLEAKRKKGIDHAALDRARTPAASRPGKVTDIRRRA